MSDLVDFHHPLIERQIGDRHMRTPHYVVDRDEAAAGNMTGALFWPDPDHVPKPGCAVPDWKSKAFNTPDEAIAFLKEEFGEVTGYVG